MPEPARRLGYLCVALLAVCAGPAVGPAHTAPIPTRKLLSGDVEPVRRAGRVFVPLRLAAEAVNASVTWDASRRVVQIQREGHTLEVPLTGGEAQLDGTSIPLPAPPLVQEGRILVPLRFLADALAVPVRYEARTESVLLPAFEPGTLWVLPLPSLRAGIVVLTPQPSETVRSPLRIHGQANVFEGTVDLELRDERGRLLTRGFGTGAMGMYGPFNATLSFRPPATKARATLYAFSTSARDGKTRLSLVRVPVILQP